MNAFAHAGLAPLRGTSVLGAIAAALLTSSLGFSTTEAMTVLASMSVLSGAAAPAIGDYIARAQDVRARNDVDAIATALVNLVNDVGTMPQPGIEPPVLLVSGGHVPRVSNAAADLWAITVDNVRARRLDGYLIDNTIACPVRGGSSRTGWRGPYLNRLDSDPWGNRYAVNVGVLERRAGSAVVVLSAGPDEVVDTPFEQVGLPDARDDVRALVTRTD